MLFKNNDIILFLFCSATLLLFLYGIYSYFDKKLNEYKTHINETLHEHKTAINEITNDIIDVSNDIDDLKNNDDIRKIKNNIESKNKTFDKYFGELESLIFKHRNENVNRMDKEEERINEKFYMLDLHITKQHYDTCKDIENLKTKHKDTFDEIIKIKKNLKIVY